MPTFPYLPCGWVGVWTVLGACLEKRNAWRLSIWLLCGPTSLLVGSLSPILLEARGEKEPVVMKERMTLAEVPPCRACTGTRLVSMWVHTRFLSAAPVPGTVMAGSTERMGHSPCCQRTQSLGKVWPAFLQGELKPLLLPSLQWRDGLVQASFRDRWPAWKLSTWDQAQITLTPPWQLPAQPTADALIPGTLTCPISNHSCPSYLS